MKYIEAKHDLQGVIHLVRVEVTVFKVVRVCRVFVIPEIASLFFEDSVIQILQLHSYVRISHLVAEIQFTVGVPQTFITASWLNEVWFLGCFLKTYASIRQFFIKD